MKIIQRNLKEKKGQAALEFLTTYGWAILVILVMVAALSSFGILSPDRFLPDRCSVGSEFRCNEFEVFSNGSVNLILRNQLNQEVASMSAREAQVGSGIYASGDSTQVNAGTHFNCSFFNFEQNNSPLSSSSTVRGGQALSAECRVPTENIGSIGGKVTIDFDFNYQALGAQLENPLSLQVYSTIQQGQE